MKLNPRKCRVRFIEEPVSFQEGLRLQYDALLHLEDTGEESLLLLEHKPVITHGRRTNDANVLLSEDALKERGVALFETNRGGDVTYHGPGQLVGYPILDLNPDRRDIHRYMRDLETTVIETCQHFSVSSHRVEGLTGVWTQSDPPSKVAAMGVHVSRWKTSHGFALNVSTDLSAFSLIVPCGLTKPVTSLEKETKRSIALREVTDVYQQHFANVFERELI